MLYIDIPRTHIIHTQRETHTYTRTCRGIVGTMLQRGRGREIVGTMVLRGVVRCFHRYACSLLLLLPCMFLSLLISISISISISIYVYVSISIFISISISIYLSIHLSPEVYTLPALLPRVRRYLTPNKNGQFQCSPEMLKMAKESDGSCSLAGALHGV